MNHELISDDTIKIAVFHKDYSICIQTVDRLIEPVAYNDGIDFYKDGMNLAFANLLHFCTPAICNEVIWEKYKRDFITLFKKRDEQSINDFYSTVELLIASAKIKDYKDLYPILKSYEIIDEILEDWDKNNFDSTLTGFIQLVDYWGRITEQKFYAYVDYSKPLLHFKDLIDRVRDIYVNQQEIGNDRRTLQLPLKLVDVKFENSKENLVVQIADLIAGAANHYYKSIADPSLKDDLSEKISNTKLADLDHFFVWPYEAFTPEELGIVNNGKSNMLDTLVSLTDFKHRK